MVLLLFADNALSNEKKGASSRAAAPQIASQAEAAANYGRIPLTFETNRGQADPSVQFVSHGKGYTLFLRSGEAVLALRGGEQGSAKTNLRGVPPAGHIETSLVRVDLVGANKHAAIHRENEQITKTNYFIGNDPAKWRTDIPNFGRIRYSGVYPGIDLVYYGNQSRLEHDFVVSPGASPARIALAFKGARQIRIDPASGDLILAAGQCELRLLKPTTYQDSGRRESGGRIPVSSAYKLLGENKIGFEVAAYDRSRQLIIDPVLVYSTYLGGSGDGKGNGDEGNGIAVDSTGSAYIVGTTYSENFPVTPGTFQSKNRSALAKTGGTVFVSKLNPEGTALVFSTYLGGTGGDYGYAIAIDSTHHPYIIGSTYSRDFPLTCGAFRHSNDSEEDSGAASGFITKLLTAGNRLVYSTYLGGNGNYSTPPLGDVLQAIAVDASGDAYVTGYSYSSEYPRTYGAFQTHYRGNALFPNSFVTKVNPQGTELLYSTLIGGNGGDFANAIAIDAKGDAFVAGSTGSKDFPVTSGAFQTVSHGSSSAFVTELNPTGTEEVYSTYLGGSNKDAAQAIAIDTQGFAYVAGTTNSKDFPLTNGTLEDANSGVGKFLATVGSTGFASKLNPDGSALEYSTYIEGYGTSVSALAVDVSGNAYLAGTVTKENFGGQGVFQATPNALPTPGSTGKSAFLIKLDPAATVLNYATLLGGSENDSAVALALSAPGSVYVSGAADSTDFPTTIKAFQLENRAAASGATNAFISRFSLANEDNKTGYPPITSAPVITTGSGVVTSPQGNWSGAKFAPPPITANANGGMTETRPPATVEVTTTCKSPLPPVTVTVVPAFASRRYGAVNPEFSYTVSGLLNGDKIAVLLKVSTARTHVGTHPVEVAISGSATTYYEFIVNGGELKITPAPLTVTVNPATRLYGAPNPSFGYTAVGLVKGDTLSIATEATQTSPVGSYPLTAAVRHPENYIITAHDAELRITRAPLAVTATSFTIKKGQAIPKLTYAITGFRNGDTQSVVTGAPVLSTTASSSSPPGKYPITIHEGTLAAANYSFGVVAGSITIQ